MSDDNSEMPAVIELITGRWRSQILYVGTALGVFDGLHGSEPTASDDMAHLLSADPDALYRLLRALASMALLAEHDGRTFTITRKGATLRADHPTSLRAMTLLEEGPVHYAAWKHLEDIVRSGSTDGFRREFGALYFDYMRRDPAYARVFSEAMSSYSAGEAPLVRHALRDKDFHGSLICDIGGSQGSLLAELLRDHPSARGIVFDLPEVVAPHLDRPDPTNAALEFVGGDMFDGVPAADVYLLKHILHDWPDDRCDVILTVARRSAKPSSRLFICEMIVPGPQEPHFSKFIDIHMMVVQSGKQRTTDEMASLLRRSGWTLAGTQPLEGSPLSVLEARRV